MRTEQELLRLIKTNIESAEQKLKNNFSVALYSGDVTPRKPLTKAELKAIKLRQLKRKLLTPYYWLSSRIIGTWNVWIYGECKECEHDDLYW